MKANLMGHGEVSSNDIQMYEPDIDHIARACRPGRYVRSSLDSRAHDLDDYRAELRLVVWKALGVVRQRPHIDERVYTLKSLWNRARDLRRRSESAGPILEPIENQEEEEALDLRIQTEAKEMLTALASRMSMREKEVLTHFVLSGGVIREAARDATMNSSTYHHRLRAAQRNAKRILEAA